MNKLLVSLLAFLLVIIGSPAIADNGFAKHVKCETQLASGTSLTDLQILQGSTPLLSMDHYSQGKAITATSSVDCVFMLSPTAAETNWVSVTNQSVSGNSYLVQLPTVGTNSANAYWYYEVLYVTAGKTYWAGSGRCQIVPTKSTAPDGLVWQTFNSSTMIANAINAHKIAVDPHGDRAYADGKFYPLTNPSNYLPQASANAIYYPLANPSNYTTQAYVEGLIAGITFTEVDPDWNSEKASYLQTQNLAGILSTSGVARAGYATTAGTATNASRLFNEVTSWTTMVNGTATTFRVTQNLNRIVITASGEGYNGPTVGSTYTYTMTSEGQAYYPQDNGTALVRIGSDFITLDMNIEEDYYAWDHVFATLTMPVTITDTFDLASGTVTLDYVVVTNSYPAVSTQDLTAHADKASKADSFGHIQGFSVAVSNGLCWLDFGASVTGTVFRFAETNIYLWKNQP